MRYDNEAAAAARADESGCTWNGYQWQHVWMANGNCCWCRARIEEEEEQ